MQTVSFYFSLLKTSLKASISNRGAFLIEMSFMIANNLIFFSIWWIFFRQFNSVGGWHFQDMAVLMAVALGGYGSMQIFFGGIRNLSRMIVEGDLDPLMTQPKNVLLQVAGSKSHSKGWGHLMTSILFVVGQGIDTPASIPIMIVGIVSSTLVFTGFNIIAHSLPFWMKGIEGLSKKYCDTLFLLSLYPTNIYSGIFQVVLFTIIPAGLISYLPVQLVQHFSFFNLFMLIVSSVAFIGIAIAIFNRGLKQYESGNRFGIRS